MIVLDTNVISELMRLDRADRQVVAWMRELRDQPMTTVINRAEVLSGLAVLPDGRRKTQLWRDAENAFASIHVVLPLAPACAARYAEVVAVRRRAGRPIGVMDALVASICLEAGASLATRNVADFDGLGLDLHDPWQQRSAG